MSIELKINKLYGIRNEVNIKADNDLVIFAPNGTGKTSLAKGFKNLDSEFFSPSIEGDTDENSLNVLMDGHLFETPLVIDDAFLEDVFQDKETIIKEYLRLNPAPEGDLPTNILGDYADTYSDVIMELKDLGIDTTPYETEFSYNNLDSVYDINQKIRSMDDETLSTDEEIREMVGTIKNTKELILQLQETKVKNFKNLKLIIDKAIKPAVSEEINKDYTLLENIKKADRLRKFKYELDGDFKPSEDALTEIQKMLAGSGVSKEKLSDYQAYLKANKMVNKNLNKTPSAQIKAMKEKVAQFEYFIYVNKIKSKQAIFESHIEQMEIDIEKFIEGYNKYIRRINKELLKNDNLKWSIELKEIETFDEPAQFKVLFNNDERSDEDFQGFASSGQQKIILLILAVTFASNRRLVVFDDPITSMDNDNANIFTRSLENLKFNKIILTHNYNFASQFSFNSEFQMVVLDSNKDGAVSSLEVNPKSLIFISSWLKEEVSEQNKEGKIILLSSVLREMADSYISPSPRIGEPKPKDDYTKIKNKIDLYYRHTKFSDFSFSEAINDIKSSVSGDTIRSLSEELGVFKTFFEFESENKISEYVNSYNFEQKDFISFLDYVVHKYILALSIRFSVENVIIKSEKKESKWDAGKYMGIDRVAPTKYKYYKDINRKVNYLNHVNNLRWTPIIETPMHKLHMYKGLLKKKNS